jgi:hypothetical protein
VRSYLVVDVDVMRECLADLLPEYPRELTPGGLEMLLDLLLGDSVPLCRFGVGLGVGRAETVSPNEHVEARFLAEGDALASETCKCGLDGRLEIRAAKPLHEAAHGILAVNGFQEPRPIAPEFVGAHCHPPASHDVAVVQREESPRRCAQERPETAALPVDVGDDIALDEVREKVLREVLGPLRTFHAELHQEIHRPPVTPAQRLEVDTRRIAVLPLGAGDHRPRRDGKRERTRGGVVAA